MSATPALRLVTDSLSASSEGITAVSSNRQVVIDGAASLKLRQDIGNDCYSVLEVLFILAEVSPTGVIVHSANAQLRKYLGWGSDKVKRCLRELQTRGFISRSQEAAKDANTSRTVFGRGVLTLDISAVDTIPEQELTDTPGQPEGFGVWGRPLDPQLCRLILEGWEVKGAEHLIASNPILASDAVKFVHHSLSTGRPIDNPGAYARKIITSGRIAHPDVSVAPDYLTEELTLDYFMRSSAARRAFTVERAEKATESRYRHVDRIYENDLDATTKAEIDLIVSDSMEAFGLDSPEMQKRHWYNLVEEELAQRGLLASLPFREENRDQIKDQPHSPTVDPDEPPF